MSLTLALQTALSGLRVNQEGLRIAADNIANAETLGYTRKIMQQQSRLLGVFGAGVEVVGFKRNVNSTLINDLRAERMSLGALDARYDILSRTQDFMGSPSDNSAINATITSLSDAFAALAVAADDNVAQQDFITSAEKTARQIRTMTQDMQDLRSDTEQEIVSTIEDINTLAQQIKDLNDEIAIATINKQPTANLEDMRDLALEELGQYVNYSTFDGQNGRVSVVVGGGLLVDQEVSLITYDPQIAINPGTTFNDIELNGAPITDDIRGGKLKGLLEVRDVELPNMAAQIDNLARSMRDELNAVHNLGTAFPPPNSLTGSLEGLLAGTPINATGDVRIAITDADGNILDDGGGLPAVIDIDLATVGSVNDIINAINTSPSGVNGLVTASLSPDGQLVITGAGDNRISVAELTPTDMDTTDAANNRGFSHFFGLNDLFSADDMATEPGEFALSFEVDADLIADSNLVARARLSIANVADLAVGDNLIGEGDGSNAQALADKMAETLDYSAAGELSSMSRTFADYAAAIITHSANTVSKTESNLRIRIDVIANLQQRNEDISGVNIDQELASITVLEAAYNASARVISVANEMFDALERAVS